MPGGVNSPVRSFKSTKSHPIFFKQAKGSRLWSEDDVEYIDFVGSWGPMILGHQNEVVIQAIRKQTEKLVSVGACTQLETLLAQEILQAFPHYQKVRLVNSGTEACMSAIRLARGFTGRDRIVKFSGCYHGHSDALLVSAGSGLLTHGISDSAGVPQSFIEQTGILQFNDIEQLNSYFEEFHKEIACVIIEPIAGNMNFIPSHIGFLQHLQKLCSLSGCLLIFDEVMTGYRVAYGGAQELYGITPDITTLGKIIGGGLPVGAVLAREEIMDMFAPIGPVYQAGTLSGNSLAMAAGLATLRELRQTGTYEYLQELSDMLMGGLAEIAEVYKIPFRGVNKGGMFGMFFSTDASVDNLQQVKASRMDIFIEFFSRMLDNGVYFAPSYFEAGFISTSHNKTDIQQTLQQADRAMQQISKNLQTSPQQSTLQL